MVVMKEVRLLALITACREVAQPATQLIAHASITNRAGITESPEMCASAIGASSCVVASLSSAAGFSSSAICAYMTLALRVDVQAKTVPTQVILIHNLVLAARICPRACLPNLAYLQTAVLQRPWASGVGTKS